MSLLNNNKKFCVAVDFDGTLCENKFPKIGEVTWKHRRVIELIRRLKEKGAVIILWTCREDIPEGKYLTEAVEWCRKNNIPIDYVNENPEMDFGYPKYVRKIMADIYIDDKAVNINDTYNIERIILENMPP